MNKCMKASELIEVLETLISEHGDLSCWFEDYYEALEVQKVYYNKNNKEFRIS